MKYNRKSRKTSHINKTCDKSNNAIQKNSILSINEIDVVFKSMQNRNKP